MSASKKSPQTDPIEGEVVDAAPQTTAPEPTRAQPKKWRLGSVFWGLLFMLVGGLLLLDNFNIVSVNFANLWQLWPVLIIVAGASMLSLRSWVGGILAFVLGAGLLVLVAATVIENPWYNVTPQVREQTQHVGQGSDSVDIKKLDVGVKAGAAEISVSSSAPRRGVLAKLESSHMKLEQSSRTDGTTQYVTFTTESTSQLWLGNIKNKLSLDYSRSVPLVLHFNIGAASLKGDISATKLRSLDVEAGASSIDLKLGAILPEQDVRLKTGASSVKLAVPKEAGVRVYADDGLSSTEFVGVDKLTDGLYQSSGFDAATAKIIIRADLGASSFTIKRF